MTKNQLKKLRSLVAEAEHLKQEIENLPYITGDYVADTAKDYSTGYGRTIKIEGYSTEKYDRLKSRLKAKRRAIINQLTDMESFLDSVDDPNVSDMLRLIYVQGMTQEQVAEEKECSVRTLQRKLEKYLG